MLTRTDFIEIFKSFKFKRNMLLSIDLSNKSPHSTLGFKYYQNVCICLWLDGTDPRTNELVYDLDCKGIYEDIRMFIEFEYLVCSRPNKRFIFEWPERDIKFDEIGETYINYEDDRLNPADNYVVRDIIYRFLDVIVCKTPKYFGSRYKLK